MVPDSIPPTGLMLTRTGKSVLKDWLQMVEREADTSSGNLCFLQSVCYWSLDVNQDTLSLSRIQNNLILKETFQVAERENNIPQF